MKKLLFLSAVVVVLLFGLMQVYVQAQESAGNEPTTYMMIFQVVDYDSKLGDAVDYFFNEILKPQDSLTLFSPIRPYNFSQKTRESQPLKTLIARTHDVLKKDISLDAINFRSIEDAMAQNVELVSAAMGTSNTGSRTGSGGTTDPKELLMQYSQIVKNYRNQRKLGGDLFMQLAGMLKPQAGKKYICLVYQKNYRVIPDKDTMNALRGNSQYAFLAAEAFTNENTTDFMDVEKVATALKDAGVVLHLVYVDKTPRRRQGMETNELSGDIYNVFSKLSDKTGGKRVTTAKPEAALKELFGK